MSRIKRIDVQKLKSKKVEKIVKEKILLANRLKTTLKGTEERIISLVIMKRFRNSKKTELEEDTYQAPHLFH